VKAREVVRHSLVAAAFICLTLMLTAVAISHPLPYWLGGGADIAPDASRYFLIFGLAAPFFMLNNLSAAMLKCEGNMRVPSAMSMTPSNCNVVIRFIAVSF
jgi:Na+-driven multidrug efflux pump